MERKDIIEIANKLENKIKSSKIPIHTINLANEAKQEALDFIEEIKKQKDVINKEGSSLKELLKKSQTEKYDKENKWRESSYVDYEINCTSYEKTILRCYLSKSSILRTVDNEVPKSFADVQKVCYSYEILNITKCYGLPDKVKMLYSCIGDKTGSLSILRRKIEDKDFIKGNIKSDQEGTDIKVKKNNKIGYYRIKLTQNRLHYGYYFDISILELENFIAYLQYIEDYLITEIQMRGVE